MDDLGGVLAGWPVGRVSACVTDSMAVLASGGDPVWITRLASISKLLTTYAGLVAIEEGTITLDESAGTATVRHLLSHAAGYDFDSGRTAAAVGTKRIYSNVGIEIFADHLAGKAGIPFGEYLEEAVLGPLGMTHTTLTGSAAHGVESCVADLARFAQELMMPLLISAATLAEATTVQFPDLAGVVPGVGRFDPNPWGLGFEVKGQKAPHWTGTRTSPRTFGHFGGAGTFLWVDPEARIAAVALTDRPFDDWALTTWPAFSDEVIIRYGPEGGHTVVGP